MALRNRRARLLATCLTSIFAGTGVASAQGTSSSAEDAFRSTTNDEIVVTAQRREERLQDVPISITSLTGDSLLSRGLLTTEEISAATPSLTYSQVAGSAAPRIRGVGTATSLGGNENSVATYVDGVYYASPTSSILALNNIARVEVLRGPQGTLFGRNATGGLIQVTTLDPRQEVGGRVSLTYGTRDTLRASAYLTGGLAEGVAADLAVSYDNQADGFGINRFNGLEVNRAESLNIRSTVLFDFGSATTLRLSGDFATLETAGPARRPVIGSIPVTGVAYTGRPFDVNSNVQPAYRDEQGGVSARLTHRFGTFDLVSLTAYRESSTDLAFDPDGLPIAIVGADADLTARQFSQELQALSAGSGPLRWTLGLYYFWARVGYDPIVISLPPIVQTIFSLQRTESGSAYAQGTYQFSDATSLTLGLRYTNETRRIDGRGTIFTRATGLTASPPPLTASQSAERLTWRAALDHRFSPDVLVYASYNRGFKSGGFNPTTIFAGAAESFAPETLDAYEAGIKTDFFDRRLRVNTSAFYYDYSNIQLAGFSDGIQRITNGASASLYGLEVEVTARPTRGLTLTAGLSLMESKFGDYPGAQISTPLPSGGNVLAPGNATGNEVPFAPDWTLSLGLEYIVSLPRGRLEFSGQYFHSDGWFSEPDNRLRQAPYDLLNASLTWRLGADRGLSISAWGRNLTNEVYAVTLQAQNTTDIIVPAAGRTYGLTLSFEF